MQICGQITAGDEESNKEEKNSSIQSGLNTEPQEKVKNEWKRRMNELNRLEVPEVTDGWTK